MLYACNNLAISTGCNDVIFWGLKFECLSGRMTPVSVMNLDAIVSLSLAIMLLIGT